MNLFDSVLHLGTQKKRNLIPYLLSLCLGLLIFTGGLYESRIAFCQEEKEEPIQMRPRPDMRQNSLGKQKAVNPEGRKSRMRVNPVKNKKGTIADDGEHGDGRPSMRPAVPTKRLNPKSPAH